jgi:chemotaxis signal transduction protein
MDDPETIFPEIFPEIPSEISSEIPSEISLEMAPEVAPEAVSIEDQCDLFLTSSDLISSDLPSWQTRYLLSQVGQQFLAFVSAWVAEIMVVEPSKVLALPFYDPMLLGIVHGEGKIMPLVIPEASRQTARRYRTKENLTTIRLGASVGLLNGVGIIVDRIIGTVSQEQLSTRMQATATESIQIFHLEDIPPTIWQPRFYK